ncbi:MAG: RodZ domain-containing protein [Pseudomonadota bacterium]
MSDLDVPASGDPASSDLGGSVENSQASPKMAEITPGTLLRQAREAAGLHIAALAVSLKVPVKKLEALEADRFDLLPDAVFVRALASSVCRTLKIDASPVLQLLPQTSSPKLNYQGLGINAPFRAPSDGPSPSIWTQVSRPAVLWGLVFLLAALVLIFMPALKAGPGDRVAGTDSRTGTASPEKTENNVTAVEVRNMEAPRMPEVVREPVPVIDASVPALKTAVSGPSLAAASTASVVLSEVPQPSRALAPSSALASTLRPASAPAASARPDASAVAAPARPASAVVAVPSNGIVVFTAKSESWVEVTDAKGQVVLRRILAAGEVAGATGVLPMSAVVGRVDATQVQIRGKTFDLATVAKDNVARFEVK